MPTVAPSTRASDDAQSWATFVLLAVIWGSSFMFIAIGLDEGVAPLTMVAYRTFFGALLLAGVLLVTGGRMPLGWELWKRLSVLGLTNIVVPFALITWGQQYIPSGMAAILNAMVPLFTIVLAAFILHDEAISAGRIGGLVIGFVGVVLLALPSLGAVDGDPDAALAVAGMLAVAAAAFFYAIGAVYARRRLSGRAIVEMPDGTRRAASALEIAFGHIVTAFAAIVLLAILFERPEGGLVALPASAIGWVAMLWLGVLGTGLAYLLFFRLIERWGATRTTLVTYAIPLVAIALGFLVLDERLRPLELIGAAMIIAGVVIVNSDLGRRRLSSAGQAESPGSSP